MNVSSRKELVHEAATRLLGMRISGDLQGSCNTDACYAELIEPFLQRHFRLPTHDDTYAFTRTVMKEFDAAFVDADEATTLILVACASINTTHTPGPRVSTSRRRYIVDELDLRKPQNFAPGTRSFLQADPQKERERAAFHALTFAYPFDEQVRKKINIARRVLTALEAWARGAKTKNGNNVLMPRYVILVLEHGFSASIMTTIHKTMRALGVHMLILSLQELLHVRAHVAQPIRTRLVAKEARQSVLRSLRVQEAELKKLPSNDPLARWINARVGDIVQNLEPTNRGYMLDYRIVTKPQRSKANKSHGRSSAAAAEAEAAIVNDDDAEEDDTVEADDDDDDAASHEEEDEEDDASNDEEDEDDEKACHSDNDDDDSDTETKTKTKKTAKHTHSDSDSDSNSNSDEEGNEDDDDDDDGDGEEEEEDDEDDIFDTPEDEIDAKDAEDHNERQKIRRTIPEHANTIAPPRSNADLLHAQRSHSARVHVAVRHDRHARTTLRKPAAAR